MKKITRHLLTTAFAISTAMSSLHASLTPASDPQPAKKVKLKKELSQSHPRLLFSKKDIPAMKKWLTTPDGKAAMGKIESYIGASVAPNHKKFLKNADDGQRQGLWRAPMVGMHYLLTGDQKSKDKALGFMKLFLSCENWELGGEKDAGMSSSNIAIGAALLYDWLYADLDEDFRNKYRDKLLLMARRQYHQGHLNKNNSTAYWQGDPANNHRWHRNAGMVLCALAAADDNKTDDEWILAKCKEELDYVNKWLPVDGTTHEGPTYMIFGLAHLILGMQAADHCLDTKYLDNHFYKTVPAYLLSASAPGLKSVLPYGDCSSTTNIGSYANALYICAAHHKEKDLVAGVKALEKAQPKSFWLGWMDVIWKRPATPLTGNFKTAPLSTILPDVGVLYTRDSWESNAVATMFKCGPLGGYTLNKFRNDNNFKYINVAHDDFDANSFIIFNDGYITADTDGYAKHKRSSHHNTILVNGTGQLVIGRMKEDVVWNQPGSGDMTKMAVITTYKEDKDYTIIEGEAANSYPAITKGKTRPKLNQFRRSFIYAKGKYILVFDNIRAAGDAEITWLMQGKQLKAVEEASGSYAISNDGGHCDFQVLCSTDTNGTIGTSTADHRGKNIGLQQLQLTAKGTAMKFASIYNPWHQKNLAIELKTSGKKSTITVTGKGIKDSWEFKAPSSLFAPTTINGKLNNKKVAVGSKDLPPKE